MKKFFMIELLFLLLLFSCGATFPSSDTPSEVVKSYFNYINKGDTDAAFDLLSSEMQKLLGKDGKISFKEAIKTLLAIRPDIPGKEEIVDEKINGNKAVVRVYTVLKNGSSKIRYEKLINEDGKWRLSPNYNSGEKP